MSGKTAMEAAGIPRVILGAKEGLAVNNGATFSAAIAALAVHDADVLLQTADIALSMSLESMLGVISAFDPRVHMVRNHRGQMAVDERVRELTKRNRGVSLERMVEQLRRYLIGWRGYFGFCQTP